MKNLVLDSSFDSAELNLEEMKVIDGGLVDPREILIGWLAEKVLDATWDAIKQAAANSKGGNTYMNSMNAAGDPS